MSDELEMKGENDEADIDLTTPIPLIDDEEEVEGEPLGDEISLHKAAKDGLLEDINPEDVEEDDDESDPLDDDFNSEYEE